jgi:hypothetical protein
MFLPEGDIFDRTLRHAGEFAFKNGHFSGEEGTSMNQPESQRSEAALAQVRQFDPNFDYFESFSDLKLT